MSELLFGLLEKSTLRRWDKAGQRAETASTGQLKALRKHARLLRQKVDHVLHTTDARLTMPLGGQAGIRRPMHSDWAWRPELWSGPISPNGLASVPSKTRLGGQTKVFHDCPLSEFSIRQVKNVRSADIAPFGVRVDVFQFDGSFLSFAVDLPPEGVEGLTLRHIVRLDIRIESERPLEVFGRLNVRHGPNVEQLVRSFDGSSGEFAIEFDMSTTNLNEARIERAWLDLILEGPEMNEIVMRDVTLSRRPRAAT